MEEKVIRYREYRWVILTDCGKKPIGKGSREKIADNMFIKNEVNELLEKLYPP